MKNVIYKMAFLFSAVLVILLSSFTSVTSSLYSSKNPAASVFEAANVCKMNLVLDYSENIPYSNLKNNCYHNSNLIKLKNKFEQYNNMPINLDQDELKSLLHLSPAHGLFIELEIDNNYIKKYTSPFVTKNILILDERFQI